MLMVHMESRFAREMREISSLALCCLLDIVTLFQVFCITLQSLCWCLVVLKVYLSGIWEMDLVFKRLSINSFISLS